MPEEVIETPFSAQDLLEECSVSAATFEIPLKHNRRLVVKAIHSTEELLAKNRAAEQFHKLCADKVRRHKSWEPFLPITEETAGMVMELVEWVMEPKFDHLTALRFAQEAGPMLAVIHAKILQEMGKSIPLAEAGAMEQAKNA